MHFDEAPSPKGDAWISGLPRRRCSDPKTPFTWQRAAPGHQGPAVGAILGWLLGPT